MADIIIEDAKSGATFTLSEYIKSISKFSANLSRGFIKIYFEKGDEFKEVKERCINNLIKIGYRIDKNDENTGEFIFINKYIEAEYKSKSFSAVRQGQATNQLTKINVRKKDNIMPDPISGIAKITKGDSFILEIENFNQSMEIKATTYQLLDALTQALTENGLKSPKIRLSLSDYMNMRGLNDSKSASEQVERELSILSHIRIYYREMRKGKLISGFTRIAILGSNRLKNGIIEATFDVTFMELMQKYNIMQYPLSLFHVNSHVNPNTWYFGRKIAEHKNMNYFKPNADIISVETLLNSSPVMPSYDEVSKSDRMYQTRIITPFERDMNALDETFTWEYCHENGEPLTDEELANFNYDIFITLLVKITWRFYPERTKPKRKRQPKPKSLAPIAL